MADHYPDCWRDPAHHGCAVAEIERLEAATEGSRELDAEIAVQIWPALAGFQPDSERGPGHWITPQDGPTYAEDYTTSIDAALTLVPEGWYLTCLAEVGCGHFYDWAATICDHLEGRVEDGDWRSAPGQTPALALCIATVKAREARP